MNILITAYQKGFVDPKMFISIEKFLVLKKKLPNYVNAGLGEPKYNLDGSPYMDDWGRPKMMVPP